MRLLQQVIVLDNMTLGEERCCFSPDFRQTYINRVSVELVQELMSLDIDMYIYSPSRHRCE